VGRRCQGRTNHSPTLGRVGIVKAIAPVGCAVVLKRALAPGAHLPLQPVDVWGIMSRRCAERKTEGHAAVEALCLADAVMGHPRASNRGAQRS
jgi:hypothetical protein